MLTEPVHILRIREELRRIVERGDVNASLIRNGADFVLFEGIETAGGGKGLPTHTDVLVPVPPGYPSSAIDMPALPADSPLIPNVVGGANPQASLHVNGREWKVLSYHPYTNGGGPNWDPSLHGFHDYYTQIFVWLHRLI